VARAKRTTDRTDARRRFRLAQQIEDGELEGDAPSSPASTPAAAGSTKGEAAPARPSFTAAFRNAYHRANVREDLPYLPSLLRHWSFWVPLLLMIGSGVAAAVAPFEPVVIFLGQTFVYPPALIVLFICGFFAPRASYLLGAILGVMNVVVFTAVLLYTVEGLAERPTNEQLQTTFLNALVSAPPSGVLFCSLAAWYKRFLALTNPNRGRRPQPKAKPRPAR
jgi:hypothetical protein